ncbi:MAG: protein prkA [Candidatus Cloacimonetes bacterium]|nr:protein prkA [Candidatus Cloacimonadota bacterium]
MSKAGTDKPAAVEFLKQVTSKYTSTEYQRLHERISFREYIEKVVKHPQIAALSHERVYNMVMSHGVETREINGETLVVYKFFENKLFGIEDSIYALMKYFKSSADRLDTRKRILLLHGPVSGAKSTIVTLLKRGLEEYSKSDEGALYTIEWKLDDDRYQICEQQEEPLHLIPAEDRTKFFQEFGVYIEGELTPKNRKIFKELEERYNGDLNKVYDHVYCRRVVISEQDRIGIGTFQPADPKSQDMAELNGSIDYSRIGKVGSESDPDGWRFDGELNKANRGIMEFIEMLKADERFLYILLTLSQERQIKTPRFPLVSADEVIIAHTNESEYKEFIMDPTKEALMDRIIKVDVKYNLSVNQEEKIYEKLLKSEAKKLTKHVEPYSIKMAAMFAVLTRLEDPKKMTLVQKMKLYNGESIEGYKEKDLKEIKMETKREGLFGISPRSMVNIIANTLISDEVITLNAFAIMHNIHDSLQMGRFPKVSAEEAERYLDLLDLVRKEFNEVAKAEVLKAFLASYEPAMEALCANYLDHVEAFINHDKVKDPVTGEDLPPDETLMRSIEEKIGGITEARKEQFRASLMASIGSLMRKGERFNYKTDQRLRKAIEKKIFEDNRNNIKLTTFSSAQTDSENLKKLEVVKNRLVEEYGYSEHGAKDLMNYIGGLLARGDITFD